MGFGFLASFGWIFPVISCNFCLCAPERQKVNKEAQKNGFGVTKLTVSSGMESLLLYGPRMSPLRIERLYAELDNSQYHFSQLLGDAQLVHEKLAPVLAALYFRVFRVNLDSKCYLRPRGDYCASEKIIGGFLPQDKSGLLFGCGYGPIEHNATDEECVPKCHVDRCHVSEVPLDFQPSQLEHFVLRYSANSDVDEWDPADLYGKDLLYNDILGIYPLNSDTPPVFVDLMRNPPSYTGYKGASDWKLIYEETCDNASAEVPCGQTEHLYRLISGMQSSVAAWAAWNYKCINPVEAYQLKSEIPKYRNNANFYATHLGNYPDRLDNLFYTFQAILKATCRLRPFLAGFAQNLGSKGEYGELQKALFDFLGTQFQICEESQVLGSLKDSNECCRLYPSGDIQHLRHPRLLQKFNNIAKIVDCVDCEKCRLHGKLKLAGLQITIRAFAQDEFHQVLERNEIVALVHVLEYFAQSLIIVQKFKEQHRRQTILYPLQVMLAVLLILAIMYRRELFYAFFYCSLIEYEDAEVEEFPLNCH